MQDYLTKVFNWLQANPNEVVTLLFTNPESVSLPNVWAPAFQASGIAQMAYVPPSIPMKRSDVRPFLHDNASRMGRSHGLSGPRLGN